MKVCHLFHKGPLCLACETNLPCLIKDYWLPPIYYMYPIIKSQWVRMKWGWSPLQRRQQAHSRRTSGVIQEAIKCSPGCIKRRRAWWDERPPLIFMLLNILLSWRQMKPCHKITQGTHYQQGKQCCLLLCSRKKCSWENNLYYTDGKGKHESKW